MLVRGLLWVRILDAHRLSDKKPKKYSKSYSVKRSLAATRIQVLRCLTVTDNKKTWAPRVKLSVPSSALS